MTPEERLERAVRKVQADARVPALSVALHRPDRSLWTCTVGTSGTGAHPLDAGSRFRIGSVTKTFTAVLVMQARDDGLLDLDDPIVTHLDVPAHGTATIRRLLSHTAGFQREPYGDVWDVLVAPDDAALLADLARRLRVDGQRDDVAVVRLGDHQDVRRGLRVDVAEGQRGGGLVHDGRGDLSGDDAAEQAVVVHAEDPRVIP